MLQPGPAGTPSTADHLTVLGGARLLPALPAATRTGLSPAGVYELAKVISTMA